MTPAQSLSDLMARLAADPAALDTVSAEEARALLPRATALAFALAVRAAAAPPAPASDDGAGSPPGPPEPGRWLNAAQVEAAFGLTPTWLREHARELDGVPGLVSRPSRKVCLYRGATLRRWLESRTVA